MLSCAVVGGPKEQDAPILAGSAIQWVLLNDGTVPWPQGSTLRLVGGPALMCPIVEVPPVAPGQTVIIDLDVQKTEEPRDIYYSLVTHDCQPFGEIASLKVVPATPVSIPKPVVVVATSPMDDVEGGLEALQGEVKSMEWTLANLGSVPWPEDVAIKLFYNTPGFHHVPCEIKVPVVQPGMTAIAGVSMLMPEVEGTFKAMWAVTSPTHPEFGDVLLVEFNVSDFPFMEWMITESIKAESVSEAISEAISEADPADTGGASSSASPLSAAMAISNHSVPKGVDVNYDDAESPDGDFVSLGRVSGLAHGTAWILELALTNTGSSPWPADTALICCFGSGLGCGRVALESEVPAGETALLQMALCASEEDLPGKCAWVLTANEDRCFGPVFVLETQ
mmetsp:Transcript_38358/g.80285  ORF Transcript_38358/g.80285 Transcript_38358/m.80285 type:complete len:394 (+) Transcript_38358:120-1301(+)